jgi:hypothetical protein
MLPGSAVASVLTVAPVASAAVGVATVAAVARRVKTSGALIDAATFEPKTWVAIINPDGSVFEKEMLYSEILDDPARRAEAEELDKLYPNAHHGRRWSVLATRIILEKQGMPSLTVEEEIMIIESKKETA